MTKAAFSKVEVKRSHIEEIAANSFQDFHVRGFDYLCLFRSPALTVKAYFFDGDVANLPEVVMPHDHRYDFHTAVISGEVENRLYEEGVGGFVYDRFDYLTPLNGGDGFEWSRETSLRMRSSILYRIGESYACDHDDVHTIQIRAPGTILLLNQYADKVPVGSPTQAWRIAGDRSPPSLDGLYTPMTTDRAVQRLEQLQAVA